MELRGGHVKEGMMVDVRVDISSFGLSSLKVSVQFQNNLRCSFYAVRFRVSFFPNT